MPAISGNKATLAIGKQSVKGTPAASATFKLKFTGGNVEGKREIIQLAETDASRQQGQSVVVGARVEGTSEHYVRPSDFGLLAYLGLGAIATSGAGADKTHTITPADTAPYATLWKAIGGNVLIDKYSDCRIKSLRVKGGAGQALTVSVEWYGLNALFGTTDDPAAAVTESVLVYPQVTVTKGGSAPGTVENFELVLENGGEGIPADKQIQPYDFVWGELQVSGTLTMLFESDADYRRYQTGTTGGTAWTTTLASETLSIKAQETAVRSIEAVMAGMSIVEYPVNPDAGGAPIKVAMGFKSLPQPAIADYFKFLVLNQVASY